MYNCMLPNFAQKNLKWRGKKIQSYHLPIAMLQASILATDKLSKTCWSAYAANIKILGVHLLSHSYIILMRSGHKGIAKSCNANVRQTQASFLLQLITMW